MQPSAKLLHGPSSVLRPLVAVIGTTGSGKSQLAVSLAQSLPRCDLHLKNGIVLSADSMQLYKGLDVITNKVTEEEKGGVEHWGLDLVQPGEGGSWELGKWCTEAEKEIASMAQDQLPIVCGGTHYFIQHFLFPPSELSLDRSIQEEAQPGSKAPQSTHSRWQPPSPLPAIPEGLDPSLLKLLDTFYTTNPIYPEPRRSITTQPSANDNEAGPSSHGRSESEKLLSMHRLLEAIDPMEAGRWDWRDGRKVKRGIERWWERGGALDASQGQEIEEETKEVSSTGRRARFRTLIFWVYEPMETLRPRLDKRVDKMVANGLLREIAELRATAERIYKTSNNIDHTEGIFQTIGYKEFAALPLPLPDNLDPTTQRAFDAMLDRTKLSTQQYAKSQLKWIRKQLLPAIREARDLGGEVWVYVVPGGIAGEKIAEIILQDFLLDRPMSDPRTTGHPDACTLLDVLFNNEVTHVPDTATRQLLNARKTCDLCSSPGEPFSILVREWDSHLHSKVHRRSVFAKQRAEIGEEEWIARQKAEGLAKKEQRQSELRLASSKPQNEAD